MIFPVAYAQSAPAAGAPDAFGSFLPLIVIFVLFYFMLIRPQMKKNKEHRELISALKVDDEVVTNSGMIGKISHIEDNVITIDFGDCKIRFQRHAVSAILPKGTVE